MRAAGALRSKQMGRGTADCVTGPDGQPYRRGRRRRDAEQLEPLQISSHAAVEPFSCYLVG
jgi:hypothetical protein